VTASDEFRERLIAARERLGLSIREMASKLMTPRATYEQWEDGTRRTPGIAVAAAELLAPRFLRRAEKIAQMIREREHGATWAEISKRHRYSSPNGALIAVRRARESANGRS
jgi:transcriptional regulator with XRE-family HTH domain